MFLELGDILVKKEEWDAIKSGDEKAKEGLRKQLNGIESYMHILVINYDDPSSDYDTHVFVTLEELQKNRIIQSVTLHAYD